MNMKSPSLYIIAGCNGAGKATASFTILPDVLDCQQFVNADEIAKGLSPFHPESVSLEAGRIMLHRIEELLQKGITFAIETTLATRSYHSLINRAHKLGYLVHLLYIWLSSPQLAIKRVAQRVSEGGHNIPKDVIIRRYHHGISNLFNLFMPIVDTWTIIDNTRCRPQVVANDSLTLAPELYDRIKNDGETQID